MNGSHVTRREVLGAAAGLGVAALATGTARAGKDDTPKEPFGYSFNTATIMGQKLPVVEQVEIAAKAGYQGFEPWIRDLDAYVKDGGSLKDLG